MILCTLSGEATPGWKVQGSKTACYQYDSNTMAAATTLACETNFFKQYIVGRVRICSYCLGAGFC